MQANFKVVWNDEDKAFVSVEDMLNFLRTLDAVLEGETAPLDLNKVADDLEQIFLEAHD